MSARGPPGVDMGHGSTNGRNAPCLSTWTSTHSATASRWATSPRPTRPTSPPRTPHGVNYLRYWVDEGKGQIFCLVEAPDADAANTVHREAHGLVADAIYQVQEGA